MMHKDPPLIPRESALAKARALGSTKSGTHHWGMQRLSALPLVALGLWFLYSLLTQDLMHFEQALLWLQRPVNLILMTLTLMIGLYHGYLGLIVIIEDYVHPLGAKLLLLLALKVTLLGTTIALFYALVKIYTFPGIPT
jgi:succinate dehydrogenase / fumarate reductase membrane anchor subunit